MTDKSINASDRLERPLRVFHCGDMPIGTGWYLCNSFTGEKRRYINKGSNVKIGKPFKA